MRNTGKKRGTGKWKDGKGGRRGDEGRLGSKTG